MNHANTSTIKYRIFYSLFTNLFWVIFVVVKPDFHVETGFEFFTFVLSPMEFVLSMAIRFSSTVQFLRHCFHFWEFKNKVFRVFKEFIKKISTTENITCLSFIQQWLPKIWTDNPVKISLALSLLIILYLFLCLYYLFYVFLFLYISDLPILYLSPIYPQVSFSSLILSPCPSFPSSSLSLTVLWSFSFSLFLFLS